MLGLRPMEIALIAFALLLLFGASRLPQLGSSLGSAIRNFKKGFAGEDEKATSGNAPERNLADGQGTTPMTPAEKVASKQS